MTGYVPECSSSFSVPKLYDFQEVFLTNKLSRSYIREEEEQDECFIERAENWEYNEVYKF